MADTGITVDESETDTDSCMSATTLEQETGQTAPDPLTQALEEAIDVVGMSLSPVDSPPSTRPPRCPTPAASPTTRPRQRRLTTLMTR
eukprot:11103145-Alexandrium_andersonii.AAC.1